MSHFAFVAPPFPGHYNPLQALAAELIDRGHQATFIQQIDAGALLHHPRCQFVPVGARSHPAGNLQHRRARIQTIHGLSGMQAVIADLVLSTDMLCRELPAQLCDLGIDAVIADQTEAAGGLVAQRLRLPCISVAAALPINSEAEMPPPFTGWGYDPSPRGQRRNRAGYQISEVIMWRMRRVIARYATAWDLGGLRSMEDCLSPHLQLSQMVAGLDFPRHALPRQFHFTGPWRSASDEATQPPRLPPQPFAFATLGTLQGSRYRLFEIIARACREADLACVIAHGGCLSPDQTASLSDHATVYDLVPQRAVLRHATLVVTHGGMNTALDALSFGLPVAVIPLAFEQSAIAARLAHSGAGVTVRPGGLDRHALAGVLRRVAADPPYRAASKRLQNEIDAGGGSAAAADRIEHLLATDTVRGPRDHDLS